MVMIAQHIEQVSNKLKPPVKIIFNEDRRSKVSAIKGGILYEKYEMICDVAVCEKNI